MRTFIAILITLSSVAGGAKGAISISNLQLNTSTDSFDISGTFPGVLTFVNPDLSASPGFALQSFIPASSYSFTGSQPLRMGQPPILIGGDIYGDYFLVAFDSPFAAGEEISGSVNASWEGIAFDPSAVDLLHVEWGGPPGAGLLLTTVTIPEPSAFCLFGLATLGLAGYRHKT